MSGVHEKKLCEILQKMIKILVSCASLVSRVS